MEPTLPGGSAGQAGISWEQPPAPTTEDAWTLLCFRCSLPWPCVQYHHLSSEGNTACLLTPIWIIRSAPGSAATSKEKLLQNKPLAFLNFTHTALYKSQDPLKHPLVH